MYWWNWMVETGRSIDWWACKHEQALESSPHRLLRVASEGLSLLAIRRTSQRLGEVRLLGNAVIIIIITTNEAVSLTMVCAATTSTPSLVLCLLILSTSLFLVDVCTVLFFPHSLTRYPPVFSDRPTNLSTPVTGPCHGVFHESHET